MLISEVMHEYLTHDMKVIKCKTVGFHDRDSRVLLFLLNNGHCDYANYEYAKERTTWSFMTFGNIKLGNVIYEENKKKKWYKRIKNWITLQ